MFLERERVMQNYQHRILTEVDDTGFGIKYENNLSAYTPPHWHQAVELLLFVKGRVTCNFENGTRSFKPGDMYIINSHEVHETKCSRNAVYLVVHILPSVMCRHVPTFDQMRFSLTYGAEEEEKAQAYDRLKNLMKEILEETEQGESAYKLERLARLYAATSLLVKYFSKPLAVEESRLHRSDMTRLEPVLEYIQLHHGEDLPLDEAAASMGLNKEYFCRLFKKNMGVSYLQYVYQVRTTAFCRDLETTEDPISEIAERHGFKDPKMLNQYFREIYGCTPSEKRKFFREVTLEDGDDDGELD